MRIDDDETASVPRILLHDDGGTGILTEWVMRS